MEVKRGGVGGSPGSHLLCKDASDTGRARLAVVVASLLKLHKKAPKVNEKLSLAITTVALESPKHKGHPAVC